MTKQDSEKPKSMFGDILFPPDDKIWTDIMPTPEPGTVHINVSLDWIKQRDAQLGQELEDVSNGSA